MSGRPAADVDVYDTAATIVEDFRQRRATVFGQLYDLDGQHLASGHDDHRYYGWAMAGLVVAVYPGMDMEDVADALVNAQQAAAALDVDQETSPSPNT